MSLRSEILDQPQVLSRLLSTHRERVLGVARAISRRDFEFAFLAARGTSDNAGLYAKYLWGIRNALPVALAAPSMFSVYQSPPRLQRALVVAISQSGQSPDIIAVVQEGRRQGAVTLAVTNDSGSPLALSAEFVIDTDTGTEKSVAATKTYTAQLTAIALLSAGMEDRAERLEELQRLPELVGEALRLDNQIESVVARYRDMKQCVVLGRGFNYATAHEWSLKLKELSYVAAAPYSAADFRHGPLAVLEKGFPVLAVVPDGAVLADMFDMLQGVSASFGADLTVISNVKELLQVATTPLRIASDTPEWLSPIVAIVPAQLFCYHLALAKGIDVEHPRGLQKVTRTW